VNLTVSSPTNENYHTYTFDWQETSMSWAVDGTTLRTVHKADTYNATTKTYQYPQTPAKIQFSLWPAGNPSNPEGTRDWAGGQIAWDTPYMTNGYYWAQISEVDVQCYGAPAGANVSSSAQAPKSYVYNALSGLEDSVAIAAANSTLASLYATGDNPNYNPFASSSSSSSASGTASATGSAPSATDVPTVPGVVGAGSRGGSSGDGTGASDGSSGATVTTFIQGLVTTPGAKASGADRSGGGGGGGVMAALTALAVLVVVAMV